MMLQKLCSIIDLRQRLIFFGDQAVPLNNETLAVALDQPNVEWASSSSRQGSGKGDGRGRGWGGGVGAGWGLGNGRGSGNGSSSGQGNGRGRGLGWGRGGGGVKLTSIRERVYQPFRDTLVRDP